VKSPTALGSMLLLTRDGAFVFPAEKGTRDKTAPVNDALLHTTMPPNALKMQQTTYTCWEDRTAYMPWAWKSHSSEPQLFITAATHKSCSWLPRLKQHCGLIRDFQQCQRHS